MWCTHSITAMVLHLRRGKKAPFFFAHSWNDPSSTTLHLAMAIPEKLEFSFPICSLHLPKVRLFCFSSVYPSSFYSPFFLLFSDSSRLARVERVCVFLKNCLLPYSLTPFHVASHFSSLASPHTKIASSGPV